MTGSVNTDDQQAHPLATPTDTTIIAREDTKVDTYQRSGADLAIFAVSSQLSVTYRRSVKHRLLACWSCCFEICCIVLHPVCIASINIRRNNSGVRRAPCAIELPMSPRKHLPSPARSFLMPLTRRQMSNIRKLATKRDTLPSYIPVKCRSRSCLLVHSADSNARSAFLVGPVEGHCSGWMLESAPLQARR